MKKLLLFVFIFTSTIYMYGINEGCQDVRLKKGGILHVFPADKNNSVRRAIVMCPGGGYSHLSIENEGYNWVPFFHEMGYTVAILEYQMPHGNPNIPIGDAIDAMLEIRRHIKECAFEKVGIMGFSAGGHLASIITMTEDPLIRPDFSVLFYPVVTMYQDYMHRRSHNELLGEHASDDINRKYSSELNVTENTPPLFLALSNDDRNVYPLNSIRLYEAMLEKNRTVTMHIYPKGRHGWGFREEFPYHHQMLDELKFWLANLQ